MIYYAVFNRKNMKIVEVGKLGQIVSVDGFFMTKSDGGVENKYSIEHFAFELFSSTSELNNIIKVEINKRLRKEANDIGEFWDW